MWVNALSACAEIDAFSSIIGNMATEYGYIRVLSTHDVTRISITASFCVMKLFFTCKLSTEVRAWTFLNFNAFT